MTSDLTLYCSRGKSAILYSLYPQCLTLRMNLNGREKKRRNRVPKTVDRNTGPESESLGDITHQLVTKNHLQWHWINHLKVGVISSMFNSFRASGLGNWVVPVPSSIYQKTLLRTK